MATPSPDSVFREAVEALATELYHDSEWGYCREGDQCKHCHGRAEGFRRQATRYLTPLLPQLEAYYRRLITEENAAKLEARAEFVGLGTRQDILRDSANYLRGNR